LYRCFTNKIFGFVFLTARAISLCYDLFMDIYISSAALATRHWLITGLRWLGLIFLISLALILRSEERLNAQTELLMPVVVSIVINAVVLIMLINKVPPALLSVSMIIADMAIVGIFTYLSGGEPILLFTAAALGVLGALVQGTMALSVAHIVGVFVSLWLVHRYVTSPPTTASTADFNNLLPFLLILGAAGALIAYVVEQSTAKIHKQADEVGRQRSAQLDDMRERVRTMYDISYMMGSTLKYEKVLDTALEAGRLGLRLSGAGNDAELIAAVLLFHADDNALHVISGRRLTRGDTLRVLPGIAGIVGEALREALPVFGTNAKDDPELGYLAAFQYCKSVVCVPLRAVYDNFGVLVYGSERANAFNTEHSELLTAIGVQATIALQNAVLYQNLLEEKDRIIEIEDNARRKLASDLHDGPTQNVAVLATRINYCIKLIEKRPQDLPSELSKIEEIARRASTEMRQILFLWRPLVLESHGLGLALQQLAQKMEETHGQRVQVRMVGDIDFMLDKNQQVVIFHIVEEAVNNARKHANAALVGVSLSRREDTAVLQIADNGQGFDMNSTVEGSGRNSLGMINMRERAELIEGALNVDSAPDRGTVITVIVPMKDSELAKQGIVRGDNGVVDRPHKSMTKLALAAVARVNLIKDAQPTTRLT